MGLKYLFPLDADVYNTNTGEKIHGAKTRSGHGLGKLDFGVPDGTPVRAMTNGTVKKLVMILQLQLIQVVIY